MALIFQRRATFRRVVFRVSPPENVVRGHDISGKRFYKQLNPVESIRDAAKPLIFVFPVENERHPSVSGA